MEAFWLFKEVIEQINRDPTAKQQPSRRLAATNPAPAVAAKNISTATDGPDDVESAIMEALSS